MQGLAFGDLQEAGQPEGEDDEDGDEDQDEEQDEEPDEEMEIEGQLPVEAFETVKSVIYKCASCLKYICKRDQLLICPICFTGKILSQNIHTIMNTRTSKYMLMGQIN